jgi:hypothetical protein
VAEYDVPDGGMVLLALRNYSKKPLERCTSMQLSMHLREYVSWLGHGSVIASEIFAGIFRMLVYGYYWRVR